jgi:dihydrofolate reductase
MELILIAAMAANRVIGHRNSIPWRIPEDIHFFKAVTMGHPLIMGRKTYDSIGRPLPGRKMIVVSANPLYRAHPDCTVVSSLDAAIALCADAEKVFVIGGEQLYRAALPLAHTLILTLIDGVYEGDTYFPDFADQPFLLVDSRVLAASVPLTINTYRRIEPAPHPGRCHRY